MATYLQGKCYIRLIQCFLFPDLMVDHKETIEPETQIDSIRQLFTQQGRVSD